MAMAILFGILLGGLVYERVVSELAWVGVQALCCEAGECEDLVEIAIVAEGGVGDWSTNRGVAGRLLPEDEFAQLGEVRPMTGFEEVVTEDGKWCLDSVDENGVPWWARIIDLPARSVKFVYRACQSE